MTTTSAIVLRSGSGTATSFGSVTAHSRITTIEAMSSHSPPLLLLLSCSAIAAFSATTQAQVSVASGFSATTIPIGSEISGLAVSPPTSAYGAFAFVCTNDQVKRVDLSTGNVTLFASGLQAGDNRPTGACFDRGTFGGGALYISQNNGSVVTISPTGVVAPFSTGGALFSSNDLVFAPLGSPFGPNLFVTNGGPGIGPVSTVDSSGVGVAAYPAANFTNIPLGLDFPPTGSAFGGNLFVAVYAAGQLVRLTAGGGSSVFATGLGFSFDVVFSPNPTGPFGDYAYVTDPMTGSVLRVAPDGTVSVFSAGFIFSTLGWDADMAFTEAGTALLVGSGNSIVQIQPTATAAFCVGDGSGTSCPCGHPGSPGNGCPNSLNPNGAVLAATGTSSLAADTIVFAGSGMPDSSALYFQGTSQISGGIGSVFGDGLRCAGGTIIRLGTKTNAGGASQYPEASDPSVSVRGLVTGPGVPTIRTYQVWYRNAAAFCTPSTFNLTNGLSVTWGP